MADEADAASAATGRDDQVVGDALDDELSELYATSAQANCKSSTDEYVTARRRRLEQLRSECGSDADFETAKSREHWTLVGEPAAPSELTAKSREHWTVLGEPPSELDLVYVANRRHFQSLIEQDRQHGLCLLEQTAFDSNLVRRYLKPSFFVEYGDGELVVGDKIGEGGQAEIFKATIHGQDKYVLKVFKPNFSLADLERHWTVRARLSLYREAHWLYAHCCVIESGTLLNDGRFAFVMKRYWGDLRKLIDQNILANNGLGPPFPPSRSLQIMFMIALGMTRLHDEGILHRDLKASNVLVKRIEGFSHDEYVIADFESSGGAQGTRFWRAPEVLLAVKDRVTDPNVWKTIWSEKADVYSFAMTSYEVLTGRIPFGDLMSSEYDVVLRGERPLLPDYVDPRIQELLKQCWHSNPSKRPTFHEIWAKFLQFRLV